MPELFRDTIFGHALRIVSRQRILPYAEDKDPAIWKRYLDEKKLGDMAHHGNVDPMKEEDVKNEQSSTGVDTPSDTFQNNTDQHFGDGSNTEDRSVQSHRNEISGLKVDVEKGGKDVSIVTWYSDTDPEVSLEPESENLSNNT